MRLFHLAKKEDNGTRAEPLKALVPMSITEAQIAVGNAFERLNHVVAVAHPTLAATAAPFLIEFKKIIVTAIVDGVKMATIGAWVASVFQKVSQPRRYYSFGEGGSSLVDFDIDLLKDDRSDERVELERATQDQRAIRAARSVSGKRPLPRDDDDDKASKLLSNRQKKKAKKASERAAPLAAAAAGGDKVTHGAGVVIAAANVPMPAANADLDKQGKLDAWKAFNDAHPSDGAKRACWNYWHPQGCKKGGACPFAHA